MARNGSFVKSRWMLAVLLAVLILTVVLVGLWPKTPAVVPSENAASVPSVEAPVSPEPTSQTEEDKTQPSAYSLKKHSLPHVSPPTPGKLPSAKEDTAPPSVVAIRPAVTPEVNEIPPKQSEFSVTSYLTGKVEEILVKEGDAVVGSKEGGPPTLLARLHVQEWEDRLAQITVEMAQLDQKIAAVQAKINGLKTQQEASQSNYQQAKSNCEQVAAQAQGQVTASPQYQQARALMEAAEARYRADEQALSVAQADRQRLESQKPALLATQQQLTTRLGFTEIKAPFTGRVTRTLVRVGDEVSLGQVLFVLQSSDIP